MLVPGVGRVDRSRFALLAALAVDNVGSGLFLPLALLYAVRIVGLDIGTAGAVVAVAGVLGFGVPPVAGRLTHRFGPRPVVVASQLVQGAGVASYLIAGNAAGVFVAAGVLGIGTQLFYCSVFVLIADASGSERKERPFAVVGMVRSAAFGLGNLVAALALAWGSDSALRWLVAVDAGTFVAAAALLAGFVVTDRVDHATPVTGTLAVLRDGHYVALIVSAGLLGLAIDVALVGTPVFVLDVLDGPRWLPGSLLATGTVLSSVLGVQVVHLLRRQRRTRSLQMGGALLAVWAVLMLLMLWLPPAWLVPYAFATWLVMVAGTKVFFPVSGALSEAMPPRPARAASMATYQYAFTAAQVLAPAVVALFAVAGWLPWAVTAAAAIAGVAVVDWLGRVIPAEVDLPVAAPSVGES